MGNEEKLWRQIVGRFVYRKMICTPSKIHDDNENKVEKTVGDENQSKRTNQLSICSISGCFIIFVFRVVFCFLSLLICVYFNI